MKVKKNIIYNDTTNYLINDFLERMSLKEKDIKFKNGNMFEIDENDKVDFLLASNSFHFYNKRNKDFFCGFLSSDFILNKAPTSALIYIL